MKTKKQMGKRPNNQPLLKNGKLANGKNVIILKFQAKAKRYAENIEKRKQQLIAHAKKRCAECQHIIPCDKCRMRQYI